MANGKLSVIILLSIVGILFSGYLTYYTYTVGQSACELFFFGAPSCFYGLVMYALIFLLSLPLLLANRKNKILWVLSILSLIGVGFSGTLTAIIWKLGQGCAALSIYGIPPCLMGLVMYTIVFLLAISLVKKKL